MLFLPYFVIMEAAGVRLPVACFGLVSGFLWTGQPLTFLLLHDPLDTLTKFVQRVALLNQLEDRLEQCLGDVHLVHSLTSFLKGFSPALRVYNTSFRVICQYIFYIFS